MTIKSCSVIAVSVAGLAAAGGAAFAVQGNENAKIPGGLAYAEFRGYEDWQSVAVSQTKDQIKVIMANPTMIAAFKNGLPAQGKTFPDGSKVVKIEWSFKPNAQAPYAVNVPDQLKTVAMILKDTRRFPKTRGWAYAAFDYDPATKTLKPQGTGAECGYECHSRVAAQDYTYTHYALR